MLASDATLPGDGTARVAAGGPATHGELARGQSVGRYVVLSRLGAGGMGVVYAAYDPELDRKVALKLLLPGAGADRQRAQQRLQREAQAMAKLSHPNVTAVYDVGVHDDAVYVAMEFIDGQTLTDWIASAPRSWRDVTAVFVALGRGLSAAHAEGLLHRDIKPDNMMLDGKGVPRVMDFGLALTSEEMGAPSEDGTHEEDIISAHRRASSALARVTRAGGLVGTPAYMAPEQFDGAVVDARTDQFALCVSLWEALYGERPFRGDSLLELCFAVTQGRRRAPPPGRKVPAWLRRAVERGMSVSPDDRWPSVDALVAELSRDPGRRRTWWLTGVGVLAIGGAVGADAWRQQAQLCSRAGAELAEVWNDERREAVRAGLLGTGVSYAPGVWERAAPVLDAWASDWVAMHTDACEATRRAGEQSEAVMDLRMACLGRARQGLDAAAKVLGAATPQAVEHAHEVIAGLPRLERCADVEALQADVEPPPDGEAAAVDAVRAELAEAAAHREAGNYDAAFEAQGRARVAVDGLGYEPIRIEVELGLGKLQDERGEYDEAEGALRRARQLAAKWKQWDALREATVDLMTVLGDRQERTAEALVLREEAEGLSTTSPETEGMYRDGLGLVLHAQGKYAEAEAEHRAALTLAREQRGEHDPGVATLRSNLANDLFAQGKYEEAETESRAALALRKETLGEDHPHVALSHNNLAATLEAQGEYAEAEAEHRAALALRLATLGESHPDVATSRNNLALVLKEQGKYEEAEAEARAALALRRAALGEDHPDVATSLNNLASLLKVQGKHAEAESEHRAALALRRAKLGEDHPKVATSRHNLAAVLQQQGKQAEAEAEYRAALAISRKTVGEDHPDVLASRNNLAIVLFTQGKYAQAESEFRIVLDLRRRTPGEGRHVATAHNNLAAVLRAQGKYAEAESENRAALAQYREALGEDHPEVAKSRDNLSVVLMARGQLAEAEAENRAALARLRETLGEEHPDVATTRSNLAGILHAQGKHAEAESEHRAVLALRQRVLGEHHPRVATSRQDLADVLASQGRHAEAESEYRAALALRQEALGEDHPDLAVSSTRLAKTLLAQGRHDEALALLQGAWAVHERSPLPDLHAAETAFALAEALWITKTDRVRARALAQQAAQLQRRTESPDLERAMAIDRWLRGHGGAP